MRKHSVSGWFDNQSTQRRELWCSGELRRAWPRDTIDCCDDFASWGSYPDAPYGLSERPISGAGSAALAKSVAAN